MCMWTNLILGKYVRVNRVDALGREMMECVQTQIKDIKFEAPRFWYWRWILCKLQIALLIFFTFCETAMVSSASQWVGSNLLKCTKPIHRFHLPGPGWDSRCPTFFLLWFLARHWSPPLPFVKIASSPVEHQQRIPVRASHKCPASLAIMAWHGMMEMLWAAVNQSGCCLAAYPTSEISGKPSIRQFGQTTTTTTTTMMKAITMLVFQSIQQESQRNQLRAKL